MSDFKREIRYLVIKLKNLDTEAEKDLASVFREHGIVTCDCVVVEEDWTIYEQTWDSVQRMAEGLPQEVTELRANAQERERLKMELSSALNYDASNPSMCDLVVEAQLLKRESDDALRRIEELEQAEKLQIQLREKIQGERDALRSLVDQFKAATTKASMNGFGQDVTHKDDSWIDDLDHALTCTQHHDAKQMKDKAQQ